MDIPRLFFIEAWIRTCHRFSRRYSNIEITWYKAYPKYYIGVKMSAMASQIISLATVYSIVYSDADQRKHQISVSLAFVRGIHRGPGTSPHKGPVTRKIFPFDDASMKTFTARYNPRSPPANINFSTSKILLTSKAVKYHKTRLMNFKPFGDHVRDYCIFRTYTDVEWSFWRTANAF